MSLLITVLGRLGADPTTRVTPEGLKVTALNLATGCGHGEKKTTQWLKGNIFGERFSKVLPFLKKGNQVMVSGTLSRAVNTYTDKAGQTKTSPLEFSVETITLVSGDKEASSNQQTVSRSYQEEPVDDLPF